MKPKTQTINIILMDGGVGDHVASLVAVDYIIRKYPWITPLIWTPDYFKEFAAHFFKENIHIKSFSEMRGRYQPSRPTKTTQWNGITSPMKIHLLDYAFHKLCDESPPIEEKNYLQIDPDKISTLDFVLPKDYVVITTGFTADVREFLPEYINEVANYMNSRGVAPVFLGKKAIKTGSAHIIKGNFKDEIDFNAGIDLIDKTSLLQAAKIMSKAKAVIGIDNGLLHIAGCTGVPIIGGFTTVGPEMRMPVRHGILGWNFYPVTPGSLDCRYCQQKSNFLYGHDYRNCYQTEVPKKLLCTKQMTSDKFIAHLKEIL